MTRLWADAPAALRIATWWAVPAAIAPHMTTAPNGATFATVAAFALAVWATDKETTR